MVILSLLLMTLDHRFSQLEKVRGNLALIFSPVQYVVDIPLSAFSWVSFSLRTHHDLLEDNIHLKRDLRVMRAQTLKYETLENENQRLRRLLDSTSKIKDRMLIGEILRVETNDLKRQIVINKGTRHETFIGQTVIDAYGVVGQVIHTSPFISTVMLITDPDHAIPVQVARNGIRSIAVGSQENHRLELPYLATTTDVKTGDLLISSGLGGRFPYGYPVARISHIVQHNDATFPHAYATPAAHLNRHREVLLVWSGSQVPQKIFEDNQ